MSIAVPSLLVAPIRRPTARLARFSECDVNHSVTQLGDDALKLVRLHKLKDGGRGVHHGRLSYMISRWTHPRENLAATIKRHPNQIFSAMEHDVEREIYDRRAVRSVILKKPHPGAAELVERSQ